MLLHCLQLMLYLLHVPLTPNLVALGSWGPALLFSVSTAHAGQLQAQTLYSF